MDLFPNTLSEVVTRCDREGRTLVVLPAGMALDGWTPRTAPLRKDGHPTYCIIAFPAGVAANLKAGQAAGAVYGAGQTVEEAAKAVKTQLGW